MELDQGQGMTPVGGTPYICRMWAHRDREHIFTDTLEENRTRGMLILAYEHYKGKYNNRYDSLD